MKNIIEFPDKKPLDRNLIEEEASQWIVKIEGNEAPTREDIEDLKAWMARSPAHREILLRFASTWNDMDLLSKLALPMRCEREPQIRGKLLAAWIMIPALLLLAVAVRTKWYFARHPGRFATATAVMVLAVAVVMFSLPVMERSNLYQTSVGEQSTHVLADGTVLWLNTGSKVQVDYTAEKRRIVLHNGEAYFKVVPDPERPFEVYAGARMIRAVGTAFSVYREHGIVKVTVKEGKVDMAVVSLAAADTPAATATGWVRSSDRKGRTPQAPNGQAAAMEITEIAGSLVAGQSVVIQPGDDRILDNVANYEQPELARRLSWLEGKLTFAGEPLEEVVKEVSRYTPMQIEITSPELKNLRIGGQFQVGQVDALFDVLESGFGVQVTRLSGQNVQIHAKK